MNLIDFYKNKVPIYYDDLKIGDEIMFTDYNESNYFREYIERLYNISCNKLYKISNVENKRHTCGSLKCNIGYICIAIKLDDECFNFCFSYFLSCRYVLANKFGHELKIKELK